MLINRKGKIATVIVGDHHGILIPPLESYRVDPGRLRGVRCVHTHLKNEMLSDDDLNDLACCAWTLWPHLPKRTRATRCGATGRTSCPEAPTAPHGQLRDPLRPNELSIDCTELILALERELSQSRVALTARRDSERALLVSITADRRRQAQDALAELSELCRTAGITVADTIVQQRRMVDNRFLVGRGKLQEITILAMQLAWA